MKKTSQQPKTLQLPGKPQRGNTEMVWAHVEIIKAFQDIPAINYKSWEKERLQTNEAIEG